MLEIRYICDIIYFLQIWQDNQKYFDITPIVYDKKHFMNGCKFFALNFFCQMKDSLCVPCIIKPWNAAVRIESMMLWSKICYATSTKISETRSLSIYLYLRAFRCFYPRREDELRQQLIISRVLSRALIRGSCNLENKSRFTTTT